MQIRGLKLSDGKVKIVHSLPEAVMDKMKTICHDLSNDILHHYCLGRPQNPNECMDLLIWNKVPKTIVVDTVTLQVSTTNDANSFL